MKRAILAMIVGGLSLCASGETPSVGSKLPEGKGSQETARVCSGCHTIDTVVSERHDRAEWQKLVDEMVARGADGTDAELKDIVDYLAKYFGPKASGDK
jgi:hypothetical protein